jgi:hypothetical protein
MAGCGRFPENRENIREFAVFGHGSCFSHQMQLWFQYFLLNSPAIENREFVLPEQGITGNSPSPDTEKPPPK